jgi:hypothetical protein
MTVTPNCVLKTQIAAIITADVSLWSASECMYSTKFSQRI